MKTMAYKRSVLIFLVAVLFMLGAFSLRVGAVEASLKEVIMALGRTGPNFFVFIIYEIRLPRLVLAMLVGASLGMCGAALQGLFRNPLADPGLIGVSSGAALGAVLVIVLGEGFLAQYVIFWGYFALPLAAFAGGGLVTLIVYAIASRQGSTDISLLLLTGIAMGTLLSACTGLLTYFASDEALRSLTFWSMGSVASATWQSVLMVLPCTLTALCILPLAGRALNAMLLGEHVAYQSGHNIKRLKQLIIGVVALTVGSAVAASGMIGFVGLVSPHLTRLLLGADNRYVLLGSALMGSILLLIADMISRVVVAPAELPIGIPMALVGGVFFIWLLLRRQRTMR